jgi:hypothetical protein
MRKTVKLRLEQLEDRTMPSGGQWLQYWDPSLYNAVQAWKSDLQQQQ